MPQFRFTALDRAGQLTQGLMEGPDAASVIARLQRQGAIPVRAEPAGRGRLGGLLAAGGGRRLRGGELAAVTRELATMLGAGQDLDRALRFLVETAPRPRVAAVMGAVREAVRDGAALATALGQHPLSFPRLYVGLVHAGEAGGTLAPTLERLAVLLERQRSLASTVASAMIYPALLVVAAVGSVALLLTQVLPQFVPLFAQNGVALPASTQFLIEAGDAVGSYGLWALAGLAAGLLGARALLRRPGPGLMADAALLRLPVLGRLAREVLAARFTRGLGTLLLNGVPLVAALDVVRGVVGNRAAVAAVERATASAKGGAGLARPLEEAGIFPARTVHLLRLGEETAQLGALALRAADIHDEAVRLGVGRLVALLVPAITIAMGAVIAGIVSSLMLAMLSLNALAG